MIDLDSRGRVGQDCCLVGVPLGNLPRVPISYGAGPFWHHLFLSRPCGDQRLGVLVDSEGSVVTRDQFSVGKPFFGLLRKRKISGFFRIFRSENDLKFKFRISTFSDRISVFSDWKMLLVIGSCKIYEEKLKILQHFV